jgi:hypothetical protein
MGGGLLTLLFPALVPVLSDGLRGIFARFSNNAGANPQNVAERIQLMNAEVGRLNALAQLDTPAGNMSPWVADLRGSFRYLAISGILVSTIAGVFAQIDTAALAVLLDLSGASMSFIIGERMYLAVKR